MRTVGIIAEYNPFHNGHKYHIREAKRISGADFAIVIMSGDFVQRGCPAMADKFLRTEAALSGGADIVFELPVYYSTASAEYFAEGAVSLLDSLGCIDYLCFGSEVSDIALIRQLASFLCNESNEYKQSLQQLLKRGLSFPEAREAAVRLHLSGSFDDNQLHCLLSEPNGILGTEYMKALIRAGSSIVPYVVRRSENSYHDEALPEGSFASATSLRKAIEGTASVSDVSIRDKMSSPDMIIEDAFSSGELTKYIPDKSLELLMQGYRKTLPVSIDMLSPLLHYRLAYLDAASMTAFLDITPDLANRVSHEEHNLLPVSSLVSRIKSRQYTYTRVLRALLHILLEIKEADMQSYRAEKAFPYARLLGFRRTASPVLRKMQKNSLAPVITKLGAAPRQLQPLPCSMLEADLRAGELYRQLIFQAYGTLLPEEYQRGVVIK